MHKIQDRPVVIDGQIVVRPMMYIALTYDHRIIDGREAVQFLVTVKQILEDPARLVLGDGPLRNGHGDGFRRAGRREAAKTDRLAMPNQRRRLLGR